MKLRGMTTGDRIFWTIMLFLGITLLWLKIFDPFVGMWPSLVVSIGACFGFVYLTRPEEDEDDLNFNE